MELFTVNNAALKTDDKQVKKMVSKTYWWGTDLDKAGWKKWPKLKLLQQ